MKASRFRQYQNPGTHEPQHPYAQKQSTSSMVSAIPNNVVRGVDFVSETLVLRGMPICNSQCDWAQCRPIHDLAVVGC